MIVLLRTSVSQTHNLIACTCLIIAIAKLHHSLTDYKKLLFINGVPDSSGGNDSFLVNKIVEEKNKNRSKKKL